MTYILLNILFMVVVLAALWVITRTKPHSAIWPTLCIVLVMTAIFDSLIIVSGIVGYNTSTLLGFYIGKAPIEDFAYAVVAVILAATLWEYFDAKER